jgi:hypothetical protein
MISLGQPGAPPVPLANQTVFGQWGIQPIVPPRPGEAYALTTFYLPVALYATSLTATPAACRFRPQLFLSGDLVFTDELQLDLIATPPGSVGNGIVASTLNAPIPYRAGQTVALGFQASFDQNLNNCNIGLGGTSDPVQYLIPAPGSIGYIITADPYVMGG